MARVAIPTGRRAITPRPGARTPAAETDRTPFLREARGCDLALTLEVDLRCVVRVFLAPTLGVNDFDMILVRP